VIKIKNIFGKRAARKAYFDKPVLYIIFNRLDYVKKSLAVLKSVRPAKMYILADGPRENKRGEDKTVERVRKYVLDNINWECKIQTRFMEKNLGCGQNIAGGLDWFFKCEPEGIVLEDDVIPDPSFFPWALEMLDKYRSDKRVWHIGGFRPNNWVKAPVNSDYFFTNRMHCWGWASWADRFLPNFRFDISDYDVNNLDWLTEDKGILNRFHAQLSGVKQSSSTWAWRWFFAIAKGRGLCISPARNLCTNIGMSGAHYSFNFLDWKSRDPGLLSRRCSINWRHLRHPDNVELDRNAVRAIWELPSTGKRKSHGF